MFYSRGIEPRIPVADFNAYKQVQRHLTRRLWLPKVHALDTNVLQPPLALQVSGPWGLRSQWQLTHTLLPGAYGIAVIDGHKRPPGGAACALPPPHGRYMAVEKTRSPSNYLVTRLVGL